VKKALDISFNLPKSPVSVQGIIFFTNFFLASALIGWAAWIASSALAVARLASISMAFAAAVSTLFAGAWLTRRVFRKILDKLSVRETISFAPPSVGFPLRPLAAKTPDLERCLDLLARRPLKLVAEALRKDETPWTPPLWTFQASGRRLVSKDILELPSDRFQFSAANARSNQDWHSHVNVF